MGGWHTLLAARFGNELEPVKWLGLVTDGLRCQQANSFYAGRGPAVIEHKNCDHECPCLR